MKCAMHQMQSSLASCVISSLPYSHTFQVHPYIHRILTLPTFLSEYVYTVHNIVNMQCLQISHTRTVNLSVAFFFYRILQRARMHE